MKPHEEYIAWKKATDKPGESTINFGEYLEWRAAHYPRWWARLYRWLMWKISW